MTEPKVRLARESDKEAILAFCQKLPNNQKDYIPLVWDKWICDPSGHIFVVTIDDIPVAMERVVRMSDSEAWWEGLRVNPKYRGQGLSRLLESYMKHYLLENNISISRCSVLSNNQVMIDIMSRRGRRKIGSYAIYEAQPVDSQNTQLVQFGQDKFDSVWLLITKSNFSTLYASISDKCQELTKSQLRKRLVLGKVWGLQQDNQLLSIAVESPPAMSQSELWIGYVNGTKNTLSVLLRELRKLASHRDYSIIGGFFPLNDVSPTPLSLAGYQKLEEEFWVYQWQNI